MPAKSPYLSQLLNVLSKIEQHFNVKLSATGRITGLSAKNGNKVTDPKTTATQAALVAQAISQATNTVIKLAGDLGSINSMVQSQDQESVIARLNKTSFKSISATATAMEKLNLLSLNTSSKAAQLPPNLPDSVGLFKKTYNAAIALNKSLESANLLGDAIMKAKAKNPLIPDDLVTTATTMISAAAAAQTAMLAALNVAIALAQPVT